MEQTKAQMRRGVVAEMEAEGEVEDVEEEEVGEVEEGGAVEKEGPDSPVRSGLDSKHFRS